MPKKQLFVDLDRTLFDTACFVEDLWSWLGKAYGLDLAKEYKHSRSFYHYKGELYDYDFFAHLRACHLNPLEVCDQARQALADKDFLYPDAKDVLVMRPYILTYGNKSYQRFKLSLCPELADIPAIIVQEPKDRYLSRHYTHLPSILVDDKLLTNNSSNYLRFIHLDRMQLQPVIHHKHYDSINSLSYLASLLDTSSLQST